MLGRTNIHPAMAYGNTVIGPQPNRRGRAERPERRGGLNTWHRAGGRSTSAVGSREHSSALWGSSVSPSPALTPANLAGQQAGRARRPHGGLDRPSDANRLPAAGQPMGPPVGLPSRPERYHISTPTAPSAAGADSTVTVTETDSLSSLSSLASQLPSLSSAPPSVLDDISVAFDEYSLGETKRKLRRVMAQTLAVLTPGNNMNMVEIGALVSLSGVSVEILARSAEEFGRTQ